MCTGPAYAYPCYETTTFSSHYPIFNARHLRSWMWAGTCLYIQSAKSGLVETFPLQPIIRTYIRSLWSITKDCTTKHDPHHTLCIYFLVKYLHFNEIMWLAVETGKGNFIHARLHGWKDECCRFSLNVPWLSWCRIDSLVSLPSLPALSVLYHNEVWLECGWML